MYFAEEAPDKVLQKDLKKSDPASLARIFFVQAAGYGIPKHNIVCCLKNKSVNLSVA